MRRSQFFAAAFLGLVALCTSVPAHAAVTVFGTVTSIQSARQPTGEISNPPTKVLTVHRIQGGNVTVFVFKNTKYQALAGRHAAPVDLIKGSIVQVKGTQVEGAIDASKIVIIIN